MSGYYGYFGILNKNLDEEKPIFDLTSVKSKRKLPDIDSNKKNDYNKLVDNLSVLQQEYKVNSTYL